jgi:hypothetical protein
MNIAQIKAQAKELEGYDIFKADYEKKKLELKKDQIQQIRQAFCEFFLSQEFTITTTPNSVIASFGTVSITLGEETHANTVDMSLSVWMNITGTDKMKHDFKSNVTIKGSPKPTIEKDKHQIKLKELNFYKSFINGDFKFEYSYTLLSSKKVVYTIKELIEAI